MNLPKQSTVPSWVVTKPKQTKSFSREPDKRYNSQRWRKLSKARLERYPLCVVDGCGKLPQVTDHITPVSQGGDFWNGPFQSMCHSCHNRKSQSERNAPSGV